MLFIQNSCMAMTNRSWVNFYIASVKVLFQLKSVAIFLILHENKCCGYSLKAP